MFEPIFSPLNYYLNTAKSTHGNHTREYLRLLSESAQVDRNANAQTVSQLNEKETRLKSLRENASGKKTLRTVLITLLCIAYFIFALAIFQSGVSEVGKCLFLLGGLGAMIFGIVFIYIRRINALSGVGGKE